MLTPKRAFWAEFNFGLAYLPTAEDNECLAEIRGIAERCLLLTNDYWSWDREREQGEHFKEARIFNAVWFVMNQDALLTAEEARGTVKKMILDLEADFVACKDRLCG